MFKYILGNPVWCECAVICDKYKTSLWISLLINLKNPMCLYFFMKCRGWCCSALPYFVFANLFSIHSSSLKKKMWCGTFIFKILIFYFVFFLSFCFIICVLFFIFMPLQSLIVSFHNLDSLRLISKSDNTTL